MKIICWFQVILLEFCFFYFFRLSITCILKFEPEKFAIISIPSQDSKQGFHTGIPRGIPWGIPSGHQSIHQGFQQGFHGGFHQAIRDSIRDSNRDSMRDFIRPSEIPSGIPTGIPTGTKINSLPLTLGYHVWICLKVFFHQIYRCAFCCLRLFCIFRFWLYSEFFSFMLTLNLTTCRSRLGHSSDEGGTA